MASLAMLYSFLALSNAICGLATIAPKLGDGSDADWWFAYKLNAASFPNCSTTRECSFGGTVQDYHYGYGMQYLLASNSGGATEKMALNTNCIGSGADPIAKTFDQIYGGAAPNYVIWNDQFYLEPQIKLDPVCSTYSNHSNSCGAPWGHSKGAMAWDADGNGFIMQVTTPDWPGNGDKGITRPVQGNTLGCIHDDNVEVAQSFFSLKLTPSDTEAVLNAMQTASVVTDPLNIQLVKLSDSPSTLRKLAEGLGVLNTDITPFQQTLSSGVKLIAKPQALQVPAWQMVSALLKEPLRVASWWTDPKIPSAKAGTPGCWSSTLSTPLEVQIATTGEWDNVKFGLTGGLGPNYNHAKIGHSIGGSLGIMGDQNQMGSYSPDTRHCSSSQNGRGGLFFVVDDATLHSGLKDLLTGETAAYYSGPSPSPSPTPPSPGPSPTASCGGAGVASNTCRADDKKAAGCRYVYSADASKCGVSKYGCFADSSLPSGCPDKTMIV